METLPSSRVALRGALPASLQSMVNGAGRVARTPSGLSPGPYIRTLDGSIASSIAALNGEPKMKDSLKTNLNEVFCRFYQKVLESFLMFKVVGLPGCFKIKVDKT